MPLLVPQAWAARVSRAIVAEYLAAEWLLYTREPSWGAHMRFDEVTPVEDGHNVRSVRPLKLPLVDPLRDVVQVDDESTWPVRPELAGAWAGLLTAWEHVDGLLATKTPGQAWLARRTARAVVPGDRWWWEVRGWRDARDSHRYSGMDWRPLDVTVYLGWPAYFVAAAGPLRKCPACGRRVIQGRRFCGSDACNRARTTDRKRVSRARSSRGLDKRS